MDGDLVTIDELANQLKVPKSWVYGKTRLRGDDTIPCIRVGKYCRFRLEDVLVWLEQKGRRDDND